MLETIEHNLKAFFASLDIEPEGALAVVQDALENVCVQGDFVDRIREGLDLCLRHPPDGNSDPQAVWVWFSQRRIPGFDATLLEACIKDGAKAAEEYLTHLQSGGYA